MALLNFPIGTVIYWENSAIPSGWQLCDGTNGTQNLINRFIYGASIDGDVGAVGGASTHTHTTPTTGSRAAHNHGGSVNQTLGGGGGVDQTVGSGDNPASTGHTHGASASVGTANAHTHTGGTTGFASTLPKYISRVFIQRIS